MWGLVLFLRSQTCVLDRNVVSTAWQSYVTMLNQGIFVALHAHLVREDKPVTQLSAFM